MPNPLHLYIIKKFESVSFLAQYRGVFASAAAWTALITGHFTKRGDARFTQVDFNKALRYKYKAEFENGDATNDVGIYRDRLRRRGEKLQWYYVSMGDGKPRPKSYVDGKNWHAHALDALPDPILLRRSQSQSFCNVGGRS